MLTEPHPRDVRGAAKGVVHLAIPGVERRHQVRVVAAVNGGIPVDGRLNRCNRGQRLLVHLDEFGGVNRGPPGRRHHHCHRLADVAHLPACQRLCLMAAED